MISLPNNCRRSEFKIYPANWKTSKAKLTDMWVADVRFIDPKHMSEFPKGKRIRIKAGVNRLNTVKERQVVMQTFIDEYTKLFEEGYNPITDNDITKVIEQKPGTENITSVSRRTPFITALRFSLEKSSNEKETKADIQSALRSMEKAARTLGYLMIPISEIQISHIKLCLDECRASNPKFSAKRFNKVKSYISGLYKYLTEIGAAFANMAVGISSMKEEPTKPVVINQDDIERIKEHLWVYNRPFYKFMMIFYYSGGRFKELYRLKGSDVDLKEQKYWSLVKKGKNPHWVSRTIRDVALPYWQEQMQNCKPDDYVFSEDLSPGSIHVDSHQITRRWKRWVKKPLGINFTFYKLKHLSAERTAKAGSIKLAAGQMGHTTTKMAQEIYAFDEKNRIHEALKTLNTEL